MYPAFLFCNSECFLIFVSVIYKKKIFRTCIHIVGPIPVHFVQEAEELKKKTSVEGSTQAVEGPPSPMAEGPPTPTLDSQADPERDLEPRETVAGEHPGAAEVKPETVAMQTVHNNFVSDTPVMDTQAVNGPTDSKAVKKIVGDVATPLPEDGVAVSSFPASHGIAENKDVHPAESAATSPSENSSSSSSSHPISASDCREPSLRSSKLAAPEVVKEIVAPDSGGAVSPPMSETDPGDQVQIQSETVATS